MSRYVVSPRARRDLDEIWDYTAQRWSEAQAERYVRQLQSAIETVAADPTLAKSCDAIRAGYWRYPAGSHIVFFKKISKAIDIIRILHNRMDFERHL